LLAVAGKNFTGKSEDLRVWFAPGVQGQLRFAAGFGKKFLGGQMVLGGNLGKEQAALLAANNQKAVAANLDLFREDRKRRGKQRDFQLQVDKFVGLHWGKTRVLQSGAGGATHNAFPEWMIGLDHTDANGNKTGTRVNEVSD